MDANEATDVVAERQLTSGIGATFARDGLVMFHFDEDDAAFGCEAEPAAAVSARVALANAHRACLLAAGVHDGFGHASQATTHLTAVHLRKELEVNDPISRALIRMSERVVNPVVVGESVHVEATLVSMRAPISIEATQRSLDWTAEVCDGGAQRVRQYDLLLRAIEARKESDYTRALITAWELSERAARQMWRDASVGLANATGGSTGSKTFLRTNVATLIALLRVVGLLPDSLYEGLETARKARNSWTHNSREPSREETEAGLAAAAQVTMLADNASFIVPTTSGPGGFTF